MGSHRQTPARIGRYRITGRIGAGGMSRVYRAVRDGDHAEIALKATPLENDLDVEVADYQREIMVARRVQHPHVVTALDHGCCDGFIFLVMPIVAGATLSNVTRLRDPSRRPSSPKSRAWQDQWAADRLADNWLALATLGRQMADALVACHSSGVIHRDIKPGNIMLDRNGNSFLMDFGLAWLRRGQRGHKLATRAGTSRYLPPEVFQEERDERSDIYSLGLSLLELVTGRKPWGHIDHETLKKTRLTLSVPDVNCLHGGVPQILADCIQQAAAEQPFDRHQTAEELREHLTLVEQALQPPDAPPPREVWDLADPGQVLSEDVWFD